MPSSKAGAPTHITIAGTEYEIADESITPTWKDNAQPLRDHDHAIRFGHFLELTIEQNRVIWEAREKGWDVFWPSYPSAMSQAENTHKGAVEFLKGAK